VKNVLKAISAALWAVLWRALRGVLLTLAALVLFIEEWGWRPLTAAAARLAAWPPLARLEALIQRLPPRWALAMFLVPAVLLFPIKLLALWFIHQGRTALGLAVIVVAKLVGTALVGRLFILTEPQLLRYAWFARALVWWRATKARVKAAVRASRTWRVAQAVGQRGRRWLRRFKR
jgi:hypothetical protein